jgi:diadenosine tetraphosphatase ApaH/serine/threonine PP2A family protein phosphatase
MRALILSDIHANLEALTAVLDAAEGYDELWNLGDVVGYGGAPNQVIERIRPLAALHVRGNHDKVCGGLVSTLGFNPVARAAAQWTHDELNAENLAWLNSMPQGPLRPELGGVSCAHGSPLDEDQYILSVRDAWAPLQQMTTDITFFGHTHIQGGFVQDGPQWHEVHPRYRSRNEADSWRLEMPEGSRQLINPGSVGQPRDYDWRAAFAIYDSEERCVIFHRVPYDLTTSQGRILMAGLPERLAARLREGR